MGSGSWNTDTFRSYTTLTKAATLDSLGNIDTSMSNQEMFTARHIHNDLNPMNVMRECRDSDEHPKTKPVLLGLDVTGSMGQAAVEVAKKLNTIMTNLYSEIEDVEFAIIGIGDLYCDDSPIQISQFESDIRIAEHLDKVWFEFGGGGNMYESYTAAWYMGSRHCDLDCWKRGKKGIIITMGDEELNPYLQQKRLQQLTGDDLQGDVETKDLFEEVQKKFAVYHIHVNHGTSSSRRAEMAVFKKSWELLGDHYKTANLDSIADEIVDIILSEYSNKSGGQKHSEGISW